MNFSYFRDEMKFIKSISTFFALIILIACSNNPKDHPTMEADENVIRIDLDQDWKDSIRMDDYIKNIVFLESSEEALIKAAVKIREIDTKFYVLDMGQHSVKVFDGEGNYKYPLGDKGNGPGEVNFPGDFIINADRSKISVVDLNKGHTLVFDTSGQLKNEYSWFDQPIPVVNAIAWDEEYWYGLNHQWQQNQLGYLLLLNPVTGEVMKDYLSSTIDIYSNPSFYNSFTESGEKKFLTLRFEKEIYELNTDTVELFYRIDFGKYELTDKEKSLDKYQIVGVFHKQDRVSDISQFSMISDQVLFFKFSKGAKHYYYFYNLKTGEGIACKKLMIGPFSLEIWGYDGDYNLIATIQESPEPISSANYAGNSKKWIDSLSQRDFERENYALIILNGMEEIFN